MESLCRLMADSHVVEIVKSNSGILKTHMDLAKYISIHYLHMHTTFLHSSVKF